MRTQTKILRFIGISMALITTMLLHSKMSKFSVGSPDDDTSISTNKQDKNREPSVYENIYNPEALNPFFEKLKALDSLKDRKLNIVHIGDSHVQADAMTNEVRQQMQALFGNGGLGLVFPYSLMKTNGERNVRFSSNISWESQKNTMSSNTETIGITGYSLLTTNKNFVIELSLKNKNYLFNILKILTPKNKHFFELATSKFGVTIPPAPPTQVAYKTIAHKVQKGETLYSLSRKYNVQLSKIQSVNHLKGTNIRIGETLKIPTEKKIIEASSRERNINLQGFDLISNIDSLSGYTYRNLGGLDKVYLTPNAQNNNFALNGIVLENDQSGIIYHSIGVNGARFSDYNKCSLFFEQVPALQPDLIIVSLGTNETFGKLSAAQYDEQVRIFLQQIRTQYGDCPILLTSPPPSLFKRKIPNLLCEEYATILIDNAIKDNYGVFDLYSILGGVEAMPELIKQNFISNDRIHYTHEGYVSQGDLLFEAIKNNYLKYKKQSK